MNKSNIIQRATDLARPGLRLTDNSSLTASVATKLTAHEDMDLAALRDQWRRLYRAAPPKHGARQLLLLGVGWKIQEQAFGGLRGAAKRTLAELTTTLARDGDIARCRVTRLKPGARLIREWHGKTHTVIVLEDGFEWQGITVRAFFIESLQGSVGADPLGVRCRLKQKTPRSEDLSENDIYSQSQLLLIISNCEQRN